MGESVECFDRLADYPIGAEEQKQQKKQKKVIQKSHRNRTFIVKDSKMNNLTDSER
jgi:hypothetical protein